MKLAILRARSPEHARELARWTGRMMPLFDVSETEEEARYRQGPACWRISLARASGLSRVAGAEPDCPFLLCRHYPSGPGLYCACQLLPLRRLLHDDGQTGPLATIATQHFLDRAKLLGGLLRGRLPLFGVHARRGRSLFFERSSRSDLDLEFVVRRAMAILPANGLTDACSKLAKLTGKRLAFRFE